MWQCKEGCHERPDFLVVKRMEQNVTEHSFFRSDDEHLRNARPGDKGLPEGRSVMNARPALVCSLCGFTLVWGIEEDVLPVVETCRCPEAYENVYRVTWVDVDDTPRQSELIAVPACDDVVMEYIAVVALFRIQCTAPEVVKRIGLVMLVESK